MMTRIKTAAEIESMRTSGHMLASVLAFLRVKVESGISTKELADLAAGELKSLGGKPAFLGYQGFPDVLCTSVNDEVVHGIPSTQTILKQGDIIGLDFGVTYNGMVTDGAISLLVGNSGDQKIKDLLTQTEKSLMAGIAQVKNGAHIGDISSAVQEVLDKSKFGIVRDLVGHGVGHKLHEEPNIPNYGKTGSGMVLMAGMTIAIEPMATLGDYKVVIAPDKWTVQTADGSLAAHFEHTVLVTADGHEILTEIKDKP